MLLARTGEAVQQTGLSSLSIEFHYRPLISVMTSSCELLLAVSKSRVIVGPLGK